MCDKNCNGCRYYGFYQMIKQGPYAYSGEIPCLVCKRFEIKYDMFDPVNIYRATVGCTGNPSHLEAKEG